MSRDVLIALVLVAVLLNLALIAGAAIVRWRQVNAPAPGRPRESVTGPRPRPSLLPSSSLLPVRERTISAATEPLRFSTRPSRVRQGAARPGVVKVAPVPLAAGRPAADAWPAATLRPNPWPSSPTLATPPAAEDAWARAEAAAAVGLVEGLGRSVALESTDSPTVRSPIDEAALPAEPEQTESDESAPVVPARRSRASADGAGRRSRSGTGGRQRRFVLPNQGEDRGRTDRAIEAFLGEPAPSGTASAHRPRRRSRRQRTGTEGEPLVLVAALGGFDDLRQSVGRENATRFAEAYGEALRATLRSGDHVTDLGQGRLQLVVHADVEGANALTERARAVCDPWLRLAPVPLALRVRPLPPGSRPQTPTNGHSTNGNPPRPGRRPDDASQQSVAAS